MYSHSATPNAADVSTWTTPAKLKPPFPMVGQLGQAEHRRTHLYCRDQFRFAGAQSDVLLGGTPRVYDTARHMTPPLWCFGRRAGSWPSRRRRSHPDASALAGRCTPHTARCCFIMYRVSLRSLALYFLAGFAMTRHTSIAAYCMSGLAYTTNYAPSGSCHELPIVFAMPLLLQHMLLPSGLPSSVGVATPVAAGVCRAITKQSPCRWPTS